MTLRASAWRALIAGGDLDEIAKFAENLSEQPSIEWMLARMTTAHIVALGAKVPGQCRFYGRDDVAVFAMSLKSLLLWKDWPDRDEFERALLWFEAATSNMTMEHICACLRPEV